jgi:hypothetical protein
MLSVLSTHDVYNTSWVHSRLREVASDVDRCWADAEIERIGERPIGWRVRVTRRGAIESVTPLARARRSAPLNRCMTRVLGQIGWGPTDNREGGSFEVYFTARLLATR